MFVCVDLKSKKSPINITELQRNLTQFFSFF